MSTRAESRRTLSPASVLSVSEAVVEIGGRGSDARDWLEEHGLVREGPKGRRVVIWGQVLDALDRQAAEAPSPRPVPRPAGRLARKEL